MQRALYVSLALHIVILVMSYVGLPKTRPEEALMADTAMSVDLVDVAELSNLPPAPGPKPEVEPKEKPRTLAQAPEPAQREQPPPAAKPAPEPPAKPRIEREAPAEVVAPPAITQPEVSTPVVEPAPTPEFAPKKRVEAPPRPAPETAVADEKTEKPEPEKPEAKAEPEIRPAKPPAEQSKPKPNADLDFAAVLKSLETGKQQAAPGPAMPGTAAAGAAATATSRSAGASYDPGLPVTISEIDAVRRQIEQCWNLPAGARDAANLKVTIVVDMNADGTPRRAVLDEQRLAQADPQYRVAAESALRAVLNPRCHPFRLPREKYERWKTMTLVFDPKEMFGT